MTNVKRVLGVRSGNVERQLTDSDCAIWAIKAMCFQMEVSVPPANLIRRHIDLDDGGTTVRGVRDALLEFGVSAQPVQGPSDAIAHAPLPAVALIRVERTVLHYIVVLEANQRTVKYLDPAVGGSSITTTVDTFAEMFTGSLILCERKPDYVAIEFGRDVDPNRFLAGALLNESNAAVALCIGEVIQLVMLLIGILMLKNFFASSIQGAPNFWFLGGIAICTVIYMWFGKLNQLIQADIKSRTLLSLFSFATGLIRKCDFDPGKGLRETSNRCVQAVSTVANSIASLVCLPGSTLSLILYIALIATFDLWAAGYALALSVILPIAGLWYSRQNRMAKREVSRTKERNEVGLVYLMVKTEIDNELVEDLPWSQLSLCDALAKQDDVISAEGMTTSAVGRANVLAGLLIGGLQHSTMGMGHTVAVFFLLSIYTSIVSRWAKRLSSIPDSRYQVRSILDFLSDFTSEPLKFSSIKDAGLPIVQPTEARLAGTAGIEVGGTL